MPARLEKAGLEAVGWGMGNSSAMFRRLALILGVIALGLALDGCTKCGPIWDDWMHSPKSCKSDHF